MFTIRGPIEPPKKVREEAAKLLSNYLSFMEKCDVNEEMGIEAYIRIHGSKEYNDYWDLEKERIKRARNNCQLSFYKGRKTG